ncbi:MAG TPA: indole-3-glycerol phosphate synthase TrpC [Candidatus Gastranaerophilales bacterium]|nr:indole-3-glycerol phosphate synthase TrpC [Candidatus Gastranaerophilales bacterium]
MTILQKIIENKKQEVLIQKKCCNIEELKISIQNLPALKSFCNILNEYKKFDKIAVIAEVKKASPSKGVIRQDFNHIQIAKAYQKAGAAAISVLTDEKFFQGKIQYLTEIKEIVDLPVLRKDFIIDEFQIYQTRSLKADIILLIASVLEEKQLKDYFDLSKELGLDVLLEVHDQKEFDIALKTGAKIIGINNRNLNTFEVNIQNTINIIKDKNLDDVFIISESGIKTASDVKFLKENKVSGVLVGESLVNKENIEIALHNLIK